MREDIIKYAIENLLHRRLRSWLTILSILIGIMAIFAIISFGVGVQGYMDTLAEDMGSDILFVQPGGFSPPGASSIEFSDADLNAISNVKGVDIISPMFMTQVEIRQDLKKSGKWNYVAGIEVSGEGKELLFSMMDLEIEKGNFFRPQDKYKVVLGNSYMLEDKIFPDPVMLRDNIYIQGTPFKVIGFFESIGNPEDDSNIYMPIDVAQEVFDNENYQFIYLRASPNEVPEDVAAKVEKALRKERGLEEGKEDFTVQTFEEVIEVFGNILDILNGVLILIALVSVLVSAVNIANSMYTAVLERRNEIGVMKAIGAKNSTIQFVFLIESGLLGAAGGVIGIFLGYLVATAGGKFAANAGYSALQPAFPWWLILGCLVFAFLVGMLSGYFPSKQASKLKPVDALRYE